MLAVGLQKKSNSNEENFRSWNQICKFVGQNIRKSFCLNGFFGLSNIGVKTNGEKKFLKNVFLSLENIFLARKKAECAPRGLNWRRAQPSVVSITNKRRSLSLQALLSSFMTND